MVNLTSESIKIFGVVPRLIYLRSNKKVLPGFSISPYLADAPVISRIPQDNFIFTLLVRQLKINNKELSDSFGDFKLYQGNCIFYQKRGIPFITLELLFNPFENKIEVNPFYFHLIREKIGSAYPADVILMDWIYCKLILNYFLILHAGGISYNENSFLFIAPPNTGKSSMILRFLAKDNPYRYLGEDSVILNVNENKVYSTPHTSTFFHHETIWYKIGNLIFPRCKPSARQLFKTKIQETPCKVKRIFIMKKTPTTGLTKLYKNDIDRIANFVLMVQRNEFSWFKNPLLIATSSLLAFDLNNLLKKEEDLIKKFLESNIHEAYFATAPSPLEFYRLIKSHVEEETNS